MKLSLTIPNGILPKIAADLLGFQAAQTAENCKLDNGQLNPWHNYLLNSALDRRGIVKSIYLLDSLYWLEWEADVDVVPSPVSGDEDGTFYFTGAGIPQESNIVEAVTGTGTLPVNSFPLAVPIPLATPSPVATPPPAGSGDSRALQYLWTAVTSGGKEGYPSPASSEVTAAPGEEVTVSGMSLIWVAGQAVVENTFVFPTASEGGTYMYVCVQAGTTSSVEPSWGTTIGGYTIDNGAVWQCFENTIATKRIYRFASGDEYSSYKFVASISVSTTSYADTKLDSELGAACPSLNILDGGRAQEDWDPPPIDLQGLTYMGNGMMLAFKGKDLYVCEPYKPWAWPIAWVQSLSDSIVAISSSGAGNSAVITTTGRPALATGSSPATLNITRLAEEKPNLSKRGTESWNATTVYPSTDGLRVIQSDGQNLLLTADHYDTKTWEALYPATMHSCLYDNKYFGFYQSGSTEGGIVFDLLTKKLTTLDFYSFATYVDPLTGKLYFLRSTAMSGYNEILLNPDARSTTGKATQYDLTGGAGVMAGIAQPDFPRNLVLTLTDANASITALSVTIAGVLSTGETDTATYALADLAVGSTDLNEAWAEITSITINSVTGAGAGDVIDIGWGKLFGLANSIDADSDVYKVNIDNDDAGVSDQTISTTYDTIEFETDPDAAHDYQIWYNA